MSGRSEQLRKKKITKMSKTEFAKQHREALEYARAKDKNFERLLDKLGLGNSTAFAALITDIYVNTQRKIEGETSCLLLNRFMSLLKLLAGNQIDANDALNELCQTFEVEQVALEKQHIYRKLAADSSFMLKFTVL